MTHGTPFTSDRSSQFSGNAESQRTFRFRRAEKQHAATPKLYALLEDAQWHTRAEIIQRLGIDARMIRLIVEASHGQILSSDKGYKLTLQASVEEVTRAVARMKKGMESTGQHIAQILKVRGRGAAA